MSLAEDRAAARSEALARRAARDRGGRGRFRRLGARRRACPPPMPSPVSRLSRRPPCWRCAPAKRTIASRRRLRSPSAATICFGPSSPACRIRSSRSTATAACWRSTSAPARMAPALRQGEPVSFALRMPELIEAIGRAAASGEEQRVDYSERVPIDRWFETIVMPVKREPNATQAGPGADDLSRSHAAAPGRRNARRLRRQCQPRIAYAARRFVGLHRDLAGSRRARTPRRARAFSPSCRSRRGAWRG